MAWVLLTNGALGLLVSFGISVLNHAASALDTLAFTPILGVLSGILSLCGRILGMWGGLVFYALQGFSYYSYSQDFRFSFKSGLSLASIIHLSDGILIVNVAALLFFAAGALILSQRLLMPKHVKTAAGS